MTFCSKVQRSLSEVAQKVQQQQDQDGTASQTTNASFWPRVLHMVVVGLGSAEASRPARHQLALALLLADEILPGLASPPEAFDPVFSPVDELLLQSYGWKVETLALCMLLYASTESGVYNIGHPARRLQPEIAACMQA